MRPYPWLLSGVTSLRTSSDTSIRQLSVTARHVLQIAPAILPRKPTSSCANVSQELVWWCRFWLFLPWAIEADATQLAPGFTPESQ